MYNTEELAHHGILGQRWGVRRYQYTDGTRTNEGLKHLRETREDQSLSRKLRKVSSRRRMSPETASALKTTAKVVGLTAGSIIANKYAKPYLKSQATAMGKKLAISALKEIPNLPLHSISGAKAITSVGVAATKASLKGGVGLVKVGTAVAKTGASLAVSGFNS